MRKPRCNVGGNVWGGEAEDKSLLCTPKLYKYRPAAPLKYSHQPPAALSCICLLLPSSAPLLVLLPPVTAVYSLLSLDFTCITHSMQWSSQLSVFRSLITPCGSREVNPLAAGIAPLALLHERVVAVWTLCAVHGWRLHHLYCYTKGWSPF